MVLKNIDSKEDDINILKELYQKSSSNKQKELILKELKKVEIGYKNEKDNAYYLNFYDNDRFILLHDIRLEYNGKVAQIDHILITLIDIVVLESKSFKGVLTINSDGSLTVNYTKFKKTFPNPVEQTKRHAKLLKEFLEDKLDLPLRHKLLGGLPISYKVLIHPQTTITNQTLPEDFARSDSFFTKRREEIDKLDTLTILKKTSTLINEDLRKKIASLLISSHKPISIDYRKKFPIKNKENICPKCKVGKLVIRESKKNTKYKNNKFLACDRFPKCCYTQEIV